MNETRQSTEKRFSEAASENKKKRGRSTVYKRDHMEGIGRDLEIFDGRTHRTHVNQYYRAAVFGILEEHKEIPYPVVPFRHYGYRKKEKSLREITDGGTVSL